MLRICSSSTQIATGTLSLPISHTHWLCPCKVRDGVEEERGERRKGEREDVRVFGCEIYVWVHGRLFSFMNGDGREGVFGVSYRERECGVLSRIGCVFQSQFSNKRNEKIPKEKTFKQSRERETLSITFHT